MKWRDSEDDAAPQTEGGHIDFDGDKFSLKKDNEANDLRPNLFKRNLMPFVMIGAGVIVLIALLLVLFSGSRAKVDTGQIKALESKVNRLEVRIANLEANSKQIPALARQGKTLAQLKKQLNRVESSVAERMNAMATDLDSLKEKATAVRTKKIPAPETSQTPAGGEAGQYHEVRPGENLYRVGLQYGLKVNELLRLNNLEPGAVIRPGQKLKVGQ